MDSRTGNEYGSRAEAIEAGIPELDIVEISGPPKAVGRVRMACRQANARRKVRRQMQKASRKGNR